MSKPKAVLFDIGGVCVVSPFEAIVECEAKNGIPKDYINFAISRSGTNGAWSHIERGIIDMDDGFFERFKQDLHDPEAWREYHAVFKNRKKNASGNSAASSSSPAPDLPPLPSFDTTALFWDMMSRSRTPDPHMFPALRNLRRSNDFVVGALSNTVIWPAGHPYNRSSAAYDGKDDVRDYFDIFVSSADVGMRKPDPRIYQLAVARLDRWDRARGGDGIRADQIVFLDDIGTNLKTAREVGMRTIKVNLGRTDEAVKELEQVTGLELAGQKPKL